ncbi:MAG: type III secretion system export apparatus subunit SctR [Deltaproteobacteria bacterium]|jgi:type III secretion protein R|nr:type III secretion system export apparatus subunit SctR [Deltaproteobacteria bacterium]
MSEIPGPVAMMLLGVAVGLLPFMLLLATSFLKISVVLALLRNAIGVQQIPPPMAINGLAIIITIFIMFPVCQDTMTLLEQQNISAEQLKSAEILTIAGNVSGPLHDFLARHADPAVSNVLLQTAKSIWPARYSAFADPSHWIVLIPTFAISEISRAFELGFLLYLPFVCIDLVVSNILLAMGMMMVSPMTISLPFKLLLFVTLDGWTKVFQGLMLSYR